MYRVDLWLSLFHAYCIMEQNETIEPLYPNVGKKLESVKCAEYPKYSALYFTRQPRPIFYFVNHVLGAMSHFSKTLRSSYCPLLLLLLLLISKAQTREYFRRVIVFVEKTAGRIRML